MSVSSRLLERIEETNKVIEEAYDRYGTHLSLCFNGGKDSTVLLDLVMREAKKRGYTIRPFYLEVANEFDEILDFLDYSGKHWSIDIIRIKTDNLKHGLEYLVNNYNMTAVFLGVRSTDFKNCQMDFFEQTTEGWPDAMRVMPILKWTYKDIWEYIDYYKIPFCSLYNIGYTSIGSIHDTQPNPALFDAKTNTYLHARMLEDESLERKGRIKKK